MLPVAVFRMPLTSDRDGWAWRLPGARRPRPLRRDHPARRARPARPASNNRALIHADLAVAYAHLKEPEQACAALTRAAEGVQGSRSAMRFERLSAARSYLDIWGRERFVQELDEQLTAVAARL